MKPTSEVVATVVSEIAPPSYWYNSDSFKDITSWFNPLVLVQCILYLLSWLWAPFGFLLSCGGALVWGALSLLSWCFESCLDLLNSVGNWSLFRSVFDYIAGLASGGLEGLWGFLEGWGCEPTALGSWRELFTGLGGLGVVLKCAGFIAIAFLVFTFLIGFLERLLMTVAPSKERQIRHEVSQFDTKVALANGDNNASGVKNSYTGQLRTLYDNPPEDGQLTIEGRGFPSNLVFCLNRLISHLFSSFRAGLSNTKTYCQGSTLLKAIAPIVIAAALVLPGGLGSPQELLLKGNGVASLAGAFTFTVIGVVLKRVFGFRADYSEAMAEEYQIMGFAI